MECEYDGLVLSGGAARGGAFLGALHKLQTQGALKGVKAVAGTSIGALAAALVVQGCDMLQIVKKIAQRPFELQYDLVSVDQPFGIDSGTDLQNYISHLVGDDTMKDLFTKSGIQLIVCATSLLQKKAVYISARSHPDMLVARAVKLSCTVPFMFAWDECDNDVFLDGGLTDNFPVQPLRAAGCTKILGIRFKQPDPQLLPQCISAYIMAIMSCMVGELEKDDGLCCRVIALDVPVENSFVFSMPMDTLKHLFRIGFKAVA